VNFSEKSGEKMQKTYIRQLNFPQVYDIINTSFGSGGTGLSAFDAMPRQLSENGVRHRNSSGRNTCLSLLFPVQW
jgi:hypothetical protein